MEKLGRFEKIIILILILIAISGVLIFFRKTRDRELAFLKIEAQSKDASFREESNPVGGNVEEGIFAYDEMGLKSQSREGDYLAKEKDSSLEEEFGTENPQSMVASTHSLSLATEDDPAWGPENAQVVIVEFSDFLCPYCAEFSLKILPQIRSQYGSRVRFVFKDLPVESLHPGSGKVHEAGECAHEQGRFWQMHDLIFANNAALSESKLAALAEAAGLDTDAFNLCLESGQKMVEVAGDLESGFSAGIQVTPTLFINDRKIEGAVSFVEISRVIEEELAY